MVPTIKGEDLLIAEPLDYEMKIILSQNNNEHINIYFICVYKKASSAVFFYYCVVLRQ